MVALKKYLLLKFTNKKYSVFLLFILGSFVFWFMNRLSKEYSQIVEYQVRYIDLPNQFIFQETPVNQVYLRINSTGFYFFKKAFTTKKIDISLKSIEQQNKYTYYLSNENILKQVRLQIKDGIQIIEILEDKLILKLGNKSFKKVPVVPNTSLKYHLGYKSFKGIQISPDSIEVSGPEMQLQKIDKINLKPFIQTDITTSLQEELEIVRPNISKIDYNVNKVKVELEVEKITEKIMIVPVQVINSGKKDIVIYPKEVSLHCQVRLSQFNELKEHHFTLLCDYNKRGSKYMEIQLAKSSEMASSIKLQTDKVEYLILK